MEAQRDSRSTAEPDIEINDIDIEVLDGTSHPAPGRGRNQSNNSFTSDIVGGRYALQTRLRSGRLGDIYEAVDQQLDKAGNGDHRVIIELYKLHPGQSGLAEQFASQFVQILSVSHSGISRVIDFGIDGATVFFTTELLKGTTLRTVLDGNSTDSFTENEVLGVLGSAADALRYTHAKGLVHGDLNPESIFITDNFEVKIADFASAILKQVLDSSATEQHGISLSPRPVDDVYGLAAVAYEMLSNGPPFDGASRREAQRRRLKLRRIKGVPKYRCKALSDALRLQAGKRTPSIDEFANQFGIAGTESIRNDKPATRGNYRRLLLPLLFIAVAGAVAIFQLNGTTPGELLSDLQDRASRQLDTILPTGGSSPDNSQKLNIVAAEEQQGPLAKDPPESGQPVVQTKDFPPAPISQAGDSSSSRPVGIDSLPAIRADIPNSEPPTTVVEQLAPAAETMGPELPTGSYDSAKIEPLSISFGQPSVTTYERNGMVAVSIVRQGALADEASVIWWTADKSAVADRDYVDLGVRTEKMSSGQTSATVYIPLIVDSQREQRESFYVYAGSALAPKDKFDRMEVFVLDDRN